ncbi:MAG: hypothetical protein WCG45_02820 [bacterium]
MYSLTIASSVVRKNKRWHKNGKPHRIKGPALYSNEGYSFSRSLMFYYDVVEAWYKNGDFHRDNDLPAVIFANRNKEFWKNGRLYQFLEYPNGTKEWYCWNVLHKEDGPAVIYPNGDVEYWYTGNRHRIDGPAVIYGGKQYWFLLGEFQKCIV